MHHPKFINFMLAQGFKYELVSRTASLYSFSMVIPKTKLTTAIHLLLSLESLRKRDNSLILGITPVYKEMGDLVKVSVGVQFGVHINDINESMLAAVNAFLQNDTYGGVTKLMIENLKVVLTSDVIQPLPLK